MTEPVRTPAWYEEDNKRLREWLAAIQLMAVARGSYEIDLACDRALKGETVTEKETT